MLLGDPHTFFRVAHGAYTMPPDFAEMVFAEDALVDLAMHADLAAMPRSFLPFDHNYTMPPCLSEMALTEVALVPKMALTAMAWQKWPCWR